MSTQSGGGEDTQSDGGEQAHHKRQQTHVAHAHAGRQACKIGVAAMVSNVTLKQKKRGMAHKQANECHIKGSAWRSWVSMQDCVRRP